MHVRAAVRELLLATALSGVASTAHALAPSEVYAKVSPSVWRVVVYDADGLPYGLGSGVVVGPERIVTNCHVLAKAKRVSVKHDAESRDAHLELWDPPRDVCQLRVPGLDAPAVALGAAERLQVGQ